MPLCMSFTGLGKEVILRLGMSLTFWISIRKKKSQEEQIKLGMCHEHTASVLLWAEGGRQTVPGLWDRMESSIQALIHLFIHSTNDYLWSVVSINGV